MSRRGVAPAGVLLFALVSLWGTAAAVPGVPPHAFMEEKARCPDCHEVKPDGEDLLIEPHRFSVGVAETCRECHPGEQMGRSHPVDVEPRRPPDAGSWPDELPLHWSDAVRSEVITCGTCHNPHLPRLSGDRLYSVQHPWEGTGRYLTYYLRVRGNNSRDGFAPLCRACHPDL